MAAISLARATSADMAVLLRMIGDYHAIAAIRSTPSELERTLAPLMEREDVGRLLLIELDGQTIGYLAVCFGYSIEFGGRDAFIDEFYIESQHRSAGYGRDVLERVTAMADQLGIRALHLEVDHDNVGARRLYERAGFVARHRYFLMSRS